MTANPFAALGLPARPDLADDDVRAAWRRVAAATHPDRADGGDPARFAAAAAAYTELRTRYGRGEAYADLTAPTRPPAPPRDTAAQRRETATSHREAAPGPEAAAGPEPAPGPEAAAGPEPAPGPEAAAGLAARVRRGRPALLALRVAIAAAISAAAFALVGVQPAASALTVGALTWLLLTARHDLTPPR